MVRSLVANHKPTILLIQETKLGYFDNTVIRSLDGVSVETEGASGGLITLWNKDCFSVKACIFNKRCIILAWEMLALKQEVTFCNVYAPNIESKRKKLWDFLISYQSSFVMPEILIWSSTRQKGMAEFVLRKL